MPTFDLRDYRDTDSASWLECRLLSFFHTEYYDDVVTERPRFDPADYLVAVENDTVVGLMDLELFEADGKATIDVLAVHPRHQRRGIAQALLENGLARLRDRGIRTLDAWTRGDEAANAWYQSAGFVERYRYLHVYKKYDDGDEGFETPTGVKKIIMAFMHAELDQEAQLRERFSRIHACRRYVLDL
ncbi:GNAT family N-acetyltransferase [Tenggerimyces flavus]|uniref:GNAT family N-acetyltransferase n=1 Tax=Tenggerimyces flavus TaxID=1708749 RepID=A0ABV7YAD3_9ACTN|nr:GNAT family N-acetyltransferase [Tenggerimyces flavus]MBM7783510.1 ribosomal protein S18 acetylase RimI-like enzyme [Tenggerimyces flavus]